MTKKMEMFLLGWNKHAEGLIMPSAKYQIDKKKFMTWGEVLETLTVFEAQALGEREAKAYLASVYLS